MRIIAVGDVHGCFEELITLWGKICPIEGDRVYFLGDLIDKGPRSADVVSWVHTKSMEAKRQHYVVRSLQGNHERKFLRWRSHEEKRRLNPSYQNPMRVDPQTVRDWGSIADVDAEWLGGCPVFFKLGVDPLDRPLCAVHAGCLPKRVTERQHPNTLTMLRWVDDAGSMVPLQRNPQTGQLSMEKPEWAHDWMTRWDQPEHIVYGHAPRKEVDIQKAPSGTLCFGVDTGCVFGNTLTAIIWESHGIRKYNGGGGELLVDPSRYTIIQEKARTRYQENSTVQLGEEL